MTESLLSMLGTGSILDKVGGLAGLAGDDTSKALGGALPALMGGLADRAAEPGGAQVIGKMVEDADDGLLGNLGGFLDGPGIGSDDDGLIDKIFGGSGSGLGMVTGLASKLGIGGGAITKLLPMLAPMALGFLKKKRNDDGLDAAGLVGLLGKEKAHLSKGGFLDGLPGLGGLTGSAAVATAAVTAASAKMKGAGAAPAAVTRSAPVAGASPLGGIPGWLKWLLPLLLLAALIFFLATQCGGDDDEPEGNGQAVATEVPETPTEVPEEAPTEVPAEPTAVPEADPVGQWIPDVNSALGAGGFGAVTATLGADGEITVLEGIVGSEDEKAAAEAIAAGVAGIGNIDNQLVVEAVSNGTIGDIVSGDPRFSTLLSLVGEAGLADALGGEGPFTVFAPTNEAFDAVDPDAIAAVRADVDGLLSPTLLYHVVGETLLASDVAVMEEIPTLQGGSLTVTTEGDTVLVNGVPISTTDIVTDNGVIHVIDGVLVPSSVTNALLASNVNDLLALEGINFAVGSSEILPESLPTLDQAVEILSGATTGQIEIQGHTDSDGPDDANQALSEARAQAVRQYLVDNGVSEALLTAQGYGEAQPLVENDTPENKAMNRRIEFVVLDS